jgi:hypothetical protein
VIQKGIGPLATLASKELDHRLKEQFKHYGLWASYICLHFTDGSLSQHLKPQTLMNMKDPEVEFIIKSMAWKTVIWIFYWGNQFKIKFSCLGQAMILHAEA